MRKRNVFFFLLILFFAFFLTPRLFAQDGLSSCSNSDKNKEIACLEERISQLRQQKNTLSSQIQEMDAQVYIKTLTIQKTEQKITETEHEIETLNNRIDTLDSSLTNLSKVLIQRVVKGYKKRVFSFFDLFLSAENMSSLISTVKYQKTTQDNNQKLLVQVQEAKTNYEEQKTLRETKKKELDELVGALENQKVALRNQQAQKQKLLIDTRNDETTYQQLLSQARLQLTSFKSFVQTSGGDSIIAANSFGNGSDGAYYSQRDARWANQAIGYSYESILKVGCLLTSISMVAKKNGQNITPSDFAADTSHFWANTAWMRYPWPSVAGKSMVSVGNIDEELSNGNYVIVGIAYSSCAGKSGGDHYVVLTKKDGNDYIMHDPIYGPDIKFSSHYSTICSSATYK
ncbi:hypothetical protein HZC27_02355 [Candidatus Roizmanbacteria bacterium]|nr:hypothetical protein [Candidatus Roizmanbacteria bacterium]